MHTRDLAIICAALVATVAIVVGSIAYYNTHAPRVPADPLAICAASEYARSTHFCVELVRAHSRQELAR